MPRPLTDNQLRRRFQALPAEVKLTMRTLRKQLDAMPGPKALDALDVVDRMLGAVWANATSRPDSDPRLSFNPPGSASARSDSPAE